MIIVSQDKETIVNFDRTDCLWVDYDEGKYTIEASSDINYELGKYETEERAKEVLQWIVDLYEDSMWGLGKNIIKFNKQFVYRMPKK